MLDRIPLTVITGPLGSGKTTLLRHVVATVPQRVHQPEFGSISYTTAASMDRGRFETFVARLSPAVYRAKGFVRFPSGTYLFNFVAGRWDVEPFAADETALVFIGKHLTQHRTALLKQLQSCAL